MQTLPANSVLIAASQQITQSQLDSIRAGLSPFYRVYGVVGYRTVGSHSATRTIALQGNGNLVPASAVVASIKSLPGANLQQINTQTAAILARGIKDASGGFLKDALIGGAIFLSAGAAGAYALSAGGAGVTATPALAAGDAGTISTAAVDTGSTLTSTALTDSGAGALGGAGGGLGGGLGTIGEASAAAKGATQIYGQYKTMFGKTPAQSAPQASQQISPAAQSPVITYGLIAAGLSALFFIL